MNVKKQFFLVDWDNEIVDPNIENIGKDILGNLASKTVMQSVIITQMLVPLYKTTRSTLKRSNILRILQYHSAKSKYYHELFYDRNPLDSDFISPDIKALNIKNIKKSELPLKMIINLGDAVYKNYKDNQK